MVFYPKVNLILCLIFYSIILIFILFLVLGIAFNFLLGGSVEKELILFILALGFLSFLLRYQYPSIFELKNDELTIKFLFITKAKIDVTKLVGISASVFEKQNDLFYSFIIAIPSIIEVGTDFYTFRYYTSFDNTSKDDGKLIYIGSWNKEDLNAMFLYLRKNYPNIQKTIIG